MIGFKGFGRRFKSKMMGHLYVTIHPTHSAKDMMEMNEQPKKKENEVIDDRRFAKRVMEAYKHDPDMPWEYEKRSGAEWDKMRFDENPYDRNDPTHVALTTHHDLNAVKKNHPKTYNAIQEYSKASKELNEDMVGAHREMKTPEFTKKRSEKIHNGLRHYFDDLSRPTDIPVEVYSGTGVHDPEETFKTNKGTLHTPSYTSTSINKNTAYKFANAQGKEGEATKGLHIVKFNIPNGYKKGLYIGHHSHRADENELLLDKGQTWKLKKHTHFVHKPNKNWATGRPDVHLWEVEPA